MDDFEMDPAMAEAMGFTSFGSKRRKHTTRADEAFIDDSGNQIPASTGANDIPLGTRPAANDVTERAQEQGISKEMPMATARIEVASSEHGRAVETMKAMEATGEVQEDNWTIGFPPAQELAALRRGIKNARGDMVVFMPSFIDDPWKGLA
ncbi:hypothetical protein E4T47_07225 [Aureobasidium subglaciale]|nr:hypothetical protein E4T47_07225 [Aureobasidium subglaciale]